MYSSNFVNKKKASHQIKEKQTFRDDIYIDELIRQDVLTQSIGYRNPSPWKRRQSIGRRQSFIRRQSIGRREPMERKQQNKERDYNQKVQNFNQINKKSNEVHSHRPAIVDFLAKIQLSKSNQKSKSITLNQKHNSSHNATSDIKFNHNVKIPQKSNTIQQQKKIEKQVIDNPEKNTFQNIFIFYPKNATQAIKSNQKKKGKSKQSTNQQFKLTNISNFNPNHTRRISLIDFQTQNQFQISKKSIRAQKLKTQRSQEKYKLIQSNEKLIQNAFATNYFNLRNLKLKTKSSKKTKRSVKTCGQEQDEKDYSDSYLFRTFFSNKRWSNNLNIAKTLKIYSKKGFKQHLQKIKKNPIHSMDQVKNQDIN